MPRSRSLDGCSQAASGDLRALDFPHVGEHVGGFEVYVDPDELVASDCAPSRWTVRSMEAKQHARAPELRRVEVVEAVRSLRGELQQIRRGGFDPRLHVPVADRQVIDPPVRTRVAFMRRGGAQTKERKNFIACRHGHCSREMIETLLKTPHSDSTPHHANGTLYG